MSKGIRLAAACAAFALLAVGARAEVRHGSEGGFVVGDSVLVDAAPQAVWRTLTEDIGLWWHPDHTYSGDAGNLSLDARPGGCFCETLAGGGVQHLEVVYVDAGKLLRLSGGLGPLQGIGATGTLSWSLAAEAGETRLEYFYAVQGWLAEGMTGWAEPVDGVIRQQLERLERLIETGSADPPADRP